LAGNRLVAAERRFPNRLYAYDESKSPISGVPRRRPAWKPALRTGAAVVHIADHLVNAMGIGSSGERFIPSLDEKAWAVLGLGPDILGRLVEDVDEQILAVEEAFLKK
jgi:hypothetical protein